MSFSIADLAEKDGRWLRVDASSGLTHDYTEQRQAVEAMLKTTDQVFALRGVAGAGKTTALKSFMRGYGLPERYISCWLQPPKLLRL